VIHKAKTSFVWMLGDRCVRLAIGVVITALVARHLGSADFGILMFVTAIVTVVAAAVPLGMDSLATREIINDPKSGGQWIGTLLGFRVISALGGIFATVLVIAILRPNDGQATMLGVIMALGLIGQAMEGAEIGFIAGGAMPTLIVPRLIILICMATLRVAMIYLGLSVEWFAVAISLETFIAGATTIRCLRMWKGKDWLLSFELKKGFALLRVSWPLALSGLSVIMYMKLGQLLVGTNLGDQQLAIYAVGTRIPEALAFLPTILASASLPAIVRARSAGKAEYDRILLKNLRMSCLLGYATAATLTLLAEPIIKLLFGPEYLSSAHLMAVFSWSALFAFVGMARGQFLMNEKRTSLALALSAIGLAVNIIALAIGIHLGGLSGVVLASVVAYGLSAVATSFIFRLTREFGWMQIVALVTPWKAMGYLFPKIWNR
jgi:PST family polysaccharide transporter